MGNRFFYSVIITDCADPNAVMRQTIRSNLVLGCTPAIVPVTSTIEAAGQMLDALIVGNSAEGAILVNIAPRGGEGARHQNGSPFAYIKVGKAHIIATIDGYTLSLLAQMKLAESVYMIDLSDIFSWAADQKLIDARDVVWLCNTQFRSLEVQRFFPWIASGGYRLSRMTSRSLADLAPRMPPAITITDNFGNLKTNLSGDNLRKLSLAAPLEGIPLYNRLVEVPDGKPGWILGSSGGGLVELVVKGGSARELFPFLAPGTLLPLKT